MKIITVKIFKIMFMTLKDRACNFWFLFIENSISIILENVIIVEILYMVTNSLTLFSGDVGSVSYSFLSGWPCDYYEHQGVQEMML